MVMSIAQGHLIVEVGQAAILPIVDVMHLTPVERNVAIGDGTCRVMRFERSALMHGRQTFGPSDIDRHASSVEYNRNDVGLTGQTAGRFDGKVDAEIRSARGSTRPRRAGAPCQQIEIDVHDDFGSGPERVTDFGRLSGHTIDESESTSMIIRFDARFDVDGQIVAAVEHVLDSSFEDGRNGGTRHWIETTAKIRHAVVVGPRSQISAASLTFEGGDAIVSSNCGHGSLDQTSKVTKIHGGGGFGKLGRVGEELARVAPGLGEAPTDDVEMGRGGEATSQNVGQSRRRLGDVRTNDDVAGLA